MKKQLLLLPLAALTIGAFAFTYKKEVKPAKADYSKTYLTGLYERIEDPDSIDFGDTVIIMTTAGYVLNGIGGNPAYAHADSTSISLFGVANSDDNTKFAYLNNQCATVFQVCEGYGSTEQNRTFAFKGNFVDWGNPYNHYLGHNNEDQADRKGYYEDIAWFLDEFGMRPNIDAKSSWTLEYEGANRKMHMRGCDTAEPYVDLHYDYRGARAHFNFGTRDDSNVNLYRLVNSPMTVPGYNEVVTYPTKDSYYPGEPIDISGLEVAVRCNGIDFIIGYNSNTAHLFSYTQYAYGTQGQTVNVGVHIFDLNYSFDITILGNGSLRRFNKAHSLSADNRGTYLIITNDCYVINGSSIATMNNWENEEEALNEHEDYLIASEALDESVIKIERDPSNGKYYAKDVNNKYLCVGEKISNDKYYIGHSDTKVASDEITFVDASHVKIGNYYLTYSHDSEKVVYLYSTAFDSNQLFKLSTDTVSITTQVNGFVTFFESATSVCDPEGTAQTISDASWEAIKEEFFQLDVDAQGIIANTTYTHNAETAGTAANVVNRYDYMVSKYNYENFMNRSDSHLYPTSSYNVIFDSNNSSVIIVVISISTLAAISLFLFVAKKKKKQ